MKIRSRQLASQAMQALAIIAICLRVAVPTGYMPAQLADGWYLQWCPDGVAEEVLEILFDAGAEASPAHVHHGGHGAHGADSGDAPDTAAYSQCDLSGFSADAHDAIAFALALPVGRAAHSQVPLRARPGWTLRLPYRSRAPPVEFS